MSYWVKLDEKVKEIGLSFERGHRPPTQSPDFKKNVEDLVDFVIKEAQEGDMYLYFSIIAFLRHHPLVNGVLFQYVQTGADLNRNDSAHILLDPFDVTRLLHLNSLTLYFYRQP